MLVAVTWIVVVFGIVCCRSPRRNIYKDTSEVNYIKSSKVNYTVDIFKNRKTTAFFNNKY